MKAAIIIYGLWVAISFARATDATENQAPSREILLTLTQQNIVSIKPGKDLISKTIDALINDNLVSTESGKDKIREAFEVNGGGFKVFLAKKQFPIPAPRCRKDVTLLLRNTDQNALYSNEQMDTRWKLFQSMNAVIEGKMASIDVKVAIGPNLGVKFDKQGHPVLEECDVEIQTESASEHAAARAAYEKASSREQLFKLTQENIVSIEPGKDISREMFDQERGGNFEVRIPKAMFPISAPNCQKDVSLVIPVVPLSVAGGSRNQNLLNQDRWKLFQSLHAVAQGKMTRVEVLLALDVWVEVEFDRQDGHPMLRSCDASVRIKPPGHTSFTPIP
jgi:hypothetical protein